MSPRLIVYVESAASFLRGTDYKLQHMLRRARRARLAYRVVDRAATVTDPADRAFLHVDLTTVPEEFHRIHEHYAACVNGHAVTISRLLYSTVRLRRDEAYEGPVIVKTVLNHHGWPEFRYAVDRTPAMRAWHALKARITPGYVARACPGYRVYDSLSAVPARVWREPGLMVERFLPGRPEPPVEKCRYDFFYDVELTLRSVHDSLLCEPETVVSVERVPAVPPVVREVRRRLRLDFGAIDYFETADGAVVIDANKTVGISPSWVERFEPLARHLEQATDRLIDFARRGTT
jgi:hypothetical protein